MHRPTMPPQGFGPPPGAHHYGPLPSGRPSAGLLPAGLPPPQRPPAGYRPSLPLGNLPPGPPISGFRSESSPSMIKPPQSPPIQKMAEISLSSHREPSNYSDSQFLSNGVADVNSSAFATQSRPVSNENLGMNANAAYSNSQTSEPNRLSESPLMPRTSNTPDTLQNKFQRETPNESFSPSLSPSLHQGAKTSAPETSTLSYSTSTVNAAISTRPYVPPSLNSTDSMRNTGSLNNTSPLPSREIGNITELHTQSGLPSNNLHGIGSQFGQSGTELSAENSEIRSTAYNSPVPQSNSQNRPSAYGLPLPSPQTGPPMHGIPSSNPKIGPQGPGIPSANFNIGPPRQGPPLTGSQMGYPMPGMSHSSSQVGPPLPGTPLSSSQMGPPMPGTPHAGPQMGSMPGAPYASSQMSSPMLGTQLTGHQRVGPIQGSPHMNTQMGPPMPGLSTSNFHSSPSMSGMVTTNTQMPHTIPPMGPSMPGMPPAGTPAGPPRAGMSMQGPQMASPRPHAVGTPVSGMPPPPGTYSMASSPNMSQAPAPPMGGTMQNRYPGANSAANPMGAYPQGGQGRRLNPDDMPSPLQVMEEDRNCRSGEFLTNMKGGLPPLVTTDYVVKDGGNASPRFIRSTMYNVPATQDMMKQASIPFGLVISPLADLQPNEGPIFHGASLDNGPVRCNRCKGYMSNLMMFMDGGRRFQCLLCKQINEVPPDYFCHMDSQGARADKYQRPELCLGSYEFIATPEYCKDKLLPKEPAFIFVLEMSQMMLQRGIISLLCDNMKSLLEHLPKDVVSGQESSKSSVRVGFITYDSSVHFYKLTGLAPEMCILCDKESMFVPVPDGILCDAEEAAANIDKLMESIPQNFQANRETSGTLSCAIQAGMSALKASGRAGKLFVFHSSLPQCEGLGKLKNREDRKVLGTEKEKVVLSPQTTHYNNLAQDLVSVGCGVDLYLFNESYVDLATIGQVSRLTGGQCHKYTFFQPNKDAERLLDDLKINIGRSIAFDSVMRVRTSTGVRPVDFFGHFFMSNTHDIELAVVDSSKSIVVEIKHDDKITEEDGVYIQVALLYTSVGGQRRLRILNLALNICTQMADLYKNCELDALMNFFGKQSVFKFLETSAKQVKENLINRSAQILACYRKNCATPSSVGQLILPELMKLLPLYVNCLIKCDALSGGQDLTCDDRSWHMYQLSTMTVESSVAYFYPRLIPLLDIDPQKAEEIPPAVRTSYDKLSPDGVYLLENGLFMFMWVGSGTSASWMKDVFGVAAPHQLDPVLAELPELDNPVSKRVRGIIEAIREQRNLHVRLFVVPQQGKHEVIMRNYLVEDKGMFGTPSYIDFLCHVHKEIRSLLS